MRIPALVLSAFLAAPALAQAPTTLPPDLDAYVARVLTTFNVPGISLAIVRDGKVLLAKGYGVKKLGAPAPVDADTKFGIASNTKAFTATALAILVERGKIRWDAPVIRYLPDFAMYDPFVTREITVRDLLVHRSGLGLGAGDLLWWPASTYNRAEIAQRLRYIKPATSFRSAYAYDNALYLVAGQVIEKISGMSWEQFIQTELVNPIGMKNSTVRHADAGGSSGNMAATHAFVDGKLTLVPPMTSDNTNPAGGINSGANDMARWMMTQLDSGRSPDGKRLWAPAQTRQLWTGVTPMGIGNPPPELASRRAQFNLYALGFGTTDVHGRKILTHTGGLPGYLSQVTLLPEQRLGISVLTNQESSAAFQSITNRILDWFLNAAPVDWVTAYKTVTDRQEAQARSATTTQTARDTTVRPTLPLASFAGTYTDAWYGDVDVRLRGGELTIKFGHSPDLVGTLEHQKGDAFIARWTDRTLRADAFVTFELGPDKKVVQMKMLPTPGTDFSFDFQDLVLRPKPAR